MSNNRLLNEPIAVVAGGENDLATLPFGSSLYGSSARRSSGTTTSDSTRSSRGAQATTIERPFSTGTTGAASRIPVANNNRSHASLHSPTSNFAAAVFYGECHREGISPSQAERAANDISGRHRRWWVDAVAKQQDTSKSSGQKRSREEPTDSASEISGNSEGQRARDRDVIGRVSRRQEEQGGGYLYLRPSKMNRTSNGDERGEDQRGDNSVVIEIDGDPVELRVGAVSMDPVINEAEHQMAHESKASLLSILSETDGDPSSDKAREALRILYAYYQRTGLDARSKRSVLSGTWLALSRPAYNGCLGTNIHQHYLYTLGRMSFDMFRPSGLKCSIQGNFSSIQIVEGPQGNFPEHVPRRLRQEISRCRNDTDGSSSVLRTYTIIVALVIEPNQTVSGEKVSEEEQASREASGDHVVKRPIRGIMTNHGYMLPDPKVPNRLSIWFTEGTLEVNDEDTDLDEWKRIFQGAPKRDLYQRANILAAQLLLGASVPDTVDKDGTMSYEFRRPIGGHGSAYCDVMYLDDDLRILRGHNGQVYVCARLADTQTDDPTQTDTDDPDSSIK
uniref:Uncharacterized protein n=1 Tax=Attheya septentrionalis TaxID=420275 RepID=A0A7S2UMW9_9STRA|mmetsp:Transcript_29823/g.54616  ORF Transcript_29823/g.54616 Transcript_29823/m.54616 type:complete len:563 (+) Transcript_29823:68-1756(+)